MKSNFLNLNLKDIFKGLIMAVLGAVLALVYEALSTGGIDTINWKVVGAGALLAAVTYLTKNLFTNSEGEPLKTEANAKYN